MPTIMCINHRWRAAESVWLGFSLCLKCIEHIEYVSAITTWKSSPLTFLANLKEAVSNQPHVESEVK